MQSRQGTLRATARAASNQPHHGLCVPLSSMFFFFLFYPHVIFPSMFSLPILWHFCFFNLLHSSLFSRLNLSTTLSSFPLGSSPRFFSSHPPSTALYIFFLGFVLYHFPNLSVSILIYPFFRFPFFFLFIFLFWKKKEYGKALGVWSLMFLRNNNVP